MDLGIGGRAALVTGASKGIGRGIAEALVAEGALVAIASRDEERIEATANAIGATGFVHDTSDLDAAPGLLERVEAELGAPLDILVTNTGGPPVGDPLSFSREQWVEAHRTLVLAPMALIEAALPGMRRRGWGRVVNVSSPAAREPNPALMLSNSHRAAAITAFKTLARAVASDGVTLNTVLPGRIDTDRLAENYGSREAAADAARGEIPAGRLGTVEEFAAAAAFLCSGRASYITGASLVVDGGLTRAA
jgi:3-oxoacyl-[acyl-carrier protein] reductase